MINVKITKTNYLSSALDKSILNTACSLDRLTLNVTWNLNAIYFSFFPVTYNSDTVLRTWELRTRRYTNVMILYIITVTIHNIYISTIFLLLLLILLFIFYHLYAVDRTSVYYGHTAVAGRSMDGRDTLSVDGVVFKYGLHHEGFDGGWREVQSKEGRHLNDRLPLSHTNCNYYTIVFVFVFFNYYVL